MEARTYHSTATNLIQLVWLFQFLQHCEVADISTDSFTRRAEGTKRVHNVNVDFTRISLTCYVEDGFEASLLGNQLIQLLYLCMIIVEYLQKRGLRPRSAFSTAKAKVIPRSFQIS